MAEIHEQNWKELQSESCGEIKRLITETQYKPSLENINTLVRSVVKKCLEITQRELEFWFRGTDMETPKDILKAIRRHFAWLEK